VRDDGDAGSADASEEKPPRRRSKKLLLWKIVGAALGVLIVFGLGAVVSRTWTGSPSVPASSGTGGSSAASPATSSSPSIVMPDWTGNKPAIAAYGLRANLGKNLSVQSDAANPWTANIVRQDPPAGATIYPWTSVTFWTTPGVGVGGYNGPSASASSASSISPNGPLSSGTYMVGAEISAGTWHTDGGSRCYYERDRDTEGSVGSIIANDNFTGPTSITIGKSDAAVKFSGDCTWTKK
jgi:hypothetical protein